MTNKKNKALLLAAIIAVPVLALAAMLLRAVALFTAFDGEDYFFASSPLPNAFLIFTITSLLLFLLFAFLTRNKYAPAVSAERTELSLLFSSAFLSLSLIVLAFVSVLSAVGTSTPLLPLFHGALAVLSLLSFVYFAAFLRSTAIAPASPRAYLALAPALFSLVGAILLYFDRSAQMNSPAKLLALASFIALAFVFLVECRGFAAAAIPARRYLSLAIGFYFAITASVPNLIYTLVRGSELMLSSAYDFVLFAFALYFLSRLLELLPEAEKETHALVRDLAEAAEAEEKVADAPADGAATADEAVSRDEEVAESNETPKPAREKKPRAKKEKGAEAEKTE